MSQQKSVRDLVLNNILSRFLGQFNPFSGDTKRPTAWADYGFPRTLEFSQFWSMYKRNGIAYAGVVRHVEKTWASHPTILEDETQHDQTALEKGIAEMAERLQLWTMLKGADERNRVGRYSALIFLFRDGRRLMDPVESVPGGFNGLARVIPVFEGQMRPVEFITDSTSPDYGQPSLYQFTESDIGDRDFYGNPGRSVQVHPDRVFIWAEGADDGSIYGKPALEAGYNDLLTIEKIIGAGGEGFWKNARSPLNIDIEKDADLNNLARLLGTSIEGIADKVEDVVKDFDSGADKSMLLQGVKATPMTVNLPSPKEFLAGALQSFSASVSIPLPILLGHQTGERASKEDANEWSDTNMARRETFVMPNIRAIFRRLMAYGVVPEMPELYVDWADLNAPSFEEKLANAEKMSNINKAHVAFGYPVFEPNEIRAATDHEPLEDDVFDEDEEEINDPEAGPGEESDDEENAPGDTAESEESET